MASCQPRLEGQEVLSDDGVHARLRQQEVAAAHWLRFPSCFAPAREGRVPTWFLQAGMPSCCGSKLHKACP